MGWRVIALITLMGCGRVAFDPLDGLELSSHGSHTCALAEDGRMWCWGSNDFGQVGEGATVIQVTPHRVPNTPAFDLIATGEYNTFGRARDGQLWSWGTNRAGQLGIGVTTTIPEPMARPIAASNPEQIAVSQFFVCARHRDGTVTCWGDNTCGQLGDGTRVDHYAPQPVPGLSDVISLGVHDVMTCAVDGSGTLWCWGGVFTVCTTSPTQPTVVPLPKMVQVEGGCHISMCALEEVGRVWCTGENQYGQLGIGTTAASGMWTPVDFGANPPRIVEIALGGFHTCARSNDHRVFCWGDNSTGSIGVGDPTMAMALFPQQLPFFDGSIVIDDLEAGCGPTCARSGNDVYCWGRNDEGQHGDGTTAHRFEPAKISLDLR